MSFLYEKDRIRMENEEGKTIALIDFPEVAPGVVNITHTEVDDCLRGQGIAGKLNQEAAEVLRKEGRKAVLSCSYSIRWFAAHPDYQDILSDPEEEAKKAEELAGPACGIRQNG